MLDRTLAPPFVKTTSFQLPQASKIRLSNEVSLFQLDNIQQDLIKIDVIFSAGKWFEPKPEVSHFTVQMLDKGTRSMTSTQIAEFFDRYGAHIELSSNFDFTSVSLYALSKHLTILYPVFLELITSPAFEENELLQLKDHFIQGLRVKNEKTSHLASKLIRKKIFGTSHPYGRSAEESDIKQIETGNLKSYFHIRMKPSHVFILGQISDSNLAALQRDFSSINATAPSEPSFFLPETSSSSEYVEKSNSVQSSIRFGKRTVKRDHLDYAGNLILNYYLGGYFGSRLMKNLREEKGLTYGISSSINSFKNDSVILIGTDVNKENRALAIDEIAKEIKCLHSSINEEELDLAKRHFIGSLQGEIASPFSILGKIKNIELHQLPSGYYQDLITQIDNITIDELFQLAGLYFREDSFHEVTVG